MIVLHNDRPPVRVVVEQRLPVVLRVSNAPSNVAVAVGALAAHIADLTPHPPYDDLHSLSLIFENGLI